MVHRVVATVRRHYRRRDRTTRHPRCCRYRCQRASRYRTRASTRAKCSRRTRRSSTITGAIPVRCHLPDHTTCQRVLRAEASSSATRHRYRIRHRCSIRRYSRRRHIEEAPTTDTSGWTAMTEVAIATPATSATMEFSLQYPLLMLIAR